MKKVRIILIVLLIINIIVSIALILINTKDQNNNKYEEAEKYLEDRVLPRNLYDLMVNYKGKVEKEDIYKKLNIFVNYIPELKNDVNNLPQDKLKEYYKKNNNIIFEKTGINSYDEFSKLVECIINNDISANEFLYTAIVKGTINNKETETSFQIELVYKNEKNIKVKVQIDNSGNSINNIKIIPV